MKQDNIISRLIRPATLIWFSILFTSILLLDGNYEKFTVKESYISLLETVLVVIFTSYFLGKSGEHISRINNDNKENKKEDKNV